MMKKLFCLMLVLAMAMCLLVGAFSVNASAYTQGYDGMGPVVISGGKRDFKWPVPSYYNLQSCFYDHRNHCAIDISAPKNTIVVASYTGIVIKAVDGGANYYGDGFGNYVVLQHTYDLPSGTITLYTRYSHLNSVSVREGVTVKAGSEIGKIGTSGSSEGYHLDFQILYGNWQPYQTYSIDPYANQLLELPSNLLVYDSWSCGSSYYTLVKELYAKPISYLGQCTIYSSYCSVKVSASTTYIKSLPCSKQTDPTSTDVEVAYKGDQYQAIGLVKNTAGNLWYKVKTKSGSTGYMYAGDTTYLAQSVNDIKGSGITAPTNHKAGTVYVLNGTISSTYNQLTSVSAYVHAGSSEQGTKETGASASVNGNSYSLGGSAIDNKTEFNKLSVGTHTYVVRASYKNYYAKSATSLGTNTGEICVFQSTFNVTSGATSCSHSYSSRVTTAATCVSNGVRTFTCSKCGASYTETITATGNHTWDSGTITKQPTCKEAGIRTYTCTVCKGTKTESIGKTTNHNYGAWAKIDDNTHGSTCSVCWNTKTGSHTWDSGKVTKQPTCKETGIRTYTCTVCKGTKTESISKTTNHNYGAWAKIDDNTHGSTCSVCWHTKTGNHTWDSGKVNKQPTCKEAGIRTYTCTVCKGTKTESITQLSAHTYEHDCDTNCNVCGKTRSITHRYKSEWSKSQYEHWYECTVCKHKKDVSLHTPSAEATETTPQTCTTCDHIIKAALDHKHSYMSTYTVDEKGHWNKCSGCEDTNDYEEHVFENACDTDCSVCGYSRDVTHTYEENWKNDETNHWHECTVCGLMADEEAHIPGVGATETTEQTCTICGYVIAPEIDSNKPTEESIEPIESSDTQSSKDTQGDKYEELVGDFPWWIVIVLGLAFSAVVASIIIRNKKN